MKEQVFEAIIKRQMEKVSDTLILKSREYSTQDKLHNFRTAAILEQCTMEQALAGMMIKHTVSIYDMIAQDDLRFHMAKWDEKITDHIVYLYLLKAIIEEKRQTEYIVQTELGDEMVNNPTYSMFMKKQRYE